MPPSRHPYRAETDGAPSAAAATAMDAFEERVLAVVLLVAGVVGISIGLDGPSSRSTELTLGGLLAALGGWTLAFGRSRHERRRQRWVAIARQ